MAIVVRRAQGLGYIHATGPRPEPFVERGFTSLTPDVLVEQKAIEKCIFASPRYPINSLRDVPFKRRLHCKDVASANGQLPAMLGSQLSLQIVGFWLPHKPDGLRWVRRNIHIRASSSTGAERFSACRIDVAAICEAAGHPIHLSHDALEDGWRPSIVRYGESDAANEIRRIIMHATRGGLTRYYLLMSAEFYDQPGAVRICHGFSGLGGLFGGDCIAFRVFERFDSDASCLACFLKCGGNINDTNARHNQHEQSPLCHILLGLQIIPILGFLVWGLCRLKAAFRHTRETLRGYAFSEAVILLGGGGVFAFCLLYVSVNNPCP